MVGRNDEHRATAAARSDVGSRGLRTRLVTILPPVLLIFAGVLVYANSFDGVFLYDDIHHIVDDERIRQLWPPGHLWPHRRPVVIVSLAINYALGGFDPWGYHLFNLIVHLLAALTLFGVARRTLLLVGFDGSPTSGSVGGVVESDPGDRKAVRLADAGPTRDAESVRARPDHPAARWVALTIALLWLVHPLQTQSVTYVIQRGESLMGLFYLCAIYSVLRGATSARARTVWYVSAVGACALGMGSKAVMLTAPVALLLFDRAYVAGSLRQAFRRRWGLYAGSAASWGVLLLTGVVQGTIAPRQTDAVMGFGYAGATPWTYLLTQAAVIPYYLRLVFWPDALCLDYAWPFVRSVGEVALPGALMATLLGLAVWAVIKRPRLGTPGALFFLILGPTSSVVPIQDPAYEHRMYLPLAAIIVLVVWGVRAVLTRLFDRVNAGSRVRLAVSILLVGAATTALGARTVTRNRVYASDLAMWRNVVATRPDNARAHYNLGNALRARGDLAGARTSYERAVERNPKLVMAQNNLGNILRLSGAPEAALVHFRSAIHADPTFAQGYVNLGAALADLGRHEDAVATLRHACTLDPASPEAHYNLAMSLGALRRFSEAVASFETSIGLMERSSSDTGTLGRAYYFLGITLARIGRSDEAAAALSRAVSMNPNDARARSALDALP